MAGTSESDPFPTRNATSEQIRDFFAQFLSTTTVSINEAKASEIAYRWPHEATGIQLWTFSLQTYRDIFGKADGMLLWSHVHGVSDEDRRVMLRAMIRSEAMDKIVIASVFLILAFCSFSTLLTGWLVTHQSSLFSVSAFSCVLYSGIACWLWSKREQI